MVGNSVNYSDATAHIHSDRLMYWTSPRSVSTKIHLNIVFTSTPQCVIPPKFTAGILYTFFSLPTHAKFAFISVTVHIISAVQIMKLLIILIFFTFLLNTFFFGRHFLILPWAPTNSVCGLPFPYALRYVPSLIYRGNKVCKFYISALVGKIIDWLDNMHGVTMKKKVGIIMPKYRVHKDQLRLCKLLSPSK